MGVDIQLVVASVVATAATCIAATFMQVIIATAGAACMSFTAAAGAVPTLWCAYSRDRCSGCAMDKVTDHMFDSAKEAF